MLAATLKGWIIMDELGMLDNMEAPFAAAALHHQCPSLLLVDCWQEDLKHANTGEGSRRYSCTHLTFGHPACGVSCGDFLRFYFLNLIARKALHSVHSKAHMGNMPFQGRYAVDGGPPRRLRTLASGPVHFVLHLSTPHLLFRDGP